MTKILVSFLACFCLTLSAFAEKISGRLVRVSDGDTIVIATADGTEHKIRLYGIDAPEKQQPYGQASLDRLAYLLRQNTTGQILVDVLDTDQYGRKVGRVFSTVDINELLVREGLAFHYVQYDNKAGRGMSAAFAAAQAFAKRYGLGVWAQADGGVRPWDWRRVAKKRSQTSRSRSNET